KVSGRQVLGGAPDLSYLDGRGDVKYRIDFRRLYSTLLQDWLGFAQTDTATTLGGDFPTLPLFGAPAPGSVEVDAPAMALAIESNVPNPSTSRTTISYVMPQRSHARMTLSTMEGRRVTTLLDDVVDAGRHDLVLNTGSLPSGEYECLLE